jgi:hypothetical protein
VLFFTKSDYAQLVNTKEQISQKLLLHFNKGYYNAGDTLAFKCFVINTINHIGDDNNLYVILSNGKGDIISKEKYPIFNSSASGIISIPPDLETGIYYIETFTPYLINNKTIKRNQIIVNSLQNTFTDSLLNCKIYNSTNKIIPNIPNSFYIKTEYTNKIPATTEVTLTDGQSKEIKKLYTDLNGVAKIIFTPLKNQNYNLTVGKQKQNFPVTVDSFGVNMQLSFEKDILNFMVSKNYKILNNQDEFTVIAYQKKIEVYKFNFAFENYASITSGVNIAGLQSGIIKVVLLNKDKSTVWSGSIYFKNEKNFENVSLKTNYNPAKGKLYQDVIFPSKFNRFMSASVNKTDGKDFVAQSDFDFFYAINFNKNSTDEIIDFFEIPNSNNSSGIAPYLIVQPNIRAALSNTKPFPLLNDDYAIIIKGKVYEPGGNKTLSNGSIQFSYETADSSFNYSAKVKSDGSFVLDSLLFNGTMQFSYRYFDLSNKESNCLIKLNENLTNLLIDSTLENVFGYKLQKQVALVPSPKADSIKSKKKILQDAQTKPENIDINKLYTSGIYSSQSSVFIDNINKPSKDVTMLGVEFVKNRIQKLKIENGVFVNVKNFSLQSNQPTTNWVVGILVDQIPVSMSDLNLVSVIDIALVKFFDAGHVAIGNTYPGGLIAVYTKGSKFSSLAKNSNNAVENDRNKIQTFNFEGFSNNILFNIKNKTYSRLANTVYWNPSIIIPKDQNSFSFETDIIEAGKAYTLKLAGYNELGKFIHFEQPLIY